MVLLRGMVRAVVLASTAVLVGTAHGRVDCCCADDVGVHSLPSLKKIPVATRVVSCHDVSSLVRRVTQSIDEMLWLFALTCFSVREKKMKKIRERGREGGGRRGREREGEGGREREGGEGRERGEGGEGGEKEQTCSTRSNVTSSTSWGLLPGASS